MPFTFPAPGTRRGKELLAKLPENKLRFLAQQFVDLGNVPRDPGERILFFGSILRKTARSILEPLKDTPEYNLVSTNALVEYFYRMVMNDKIDPIDLPLYIEPFRWYFSIRHQPSVLREFNLTDNLQQLDPGVIVAAYQKANQTQVKSTYMALWEKFRRLVHTEYSYLIVYEDSSMIIYKPETMEQNRRILGTIGDHIHVCVGLNSHHFYHYDPMFVGVFHPTVIKPGIDFKAVKSNPYDGLVYAIATFGSGKEFHLPDNTTVPIDKEPYATYATRMLDVIAEKYPDLVANLSISESTIESYVDMSLERVPEIVSDWRNAMYIPSEILEVFILYHKNVFEKYINSVVIADLIRQFVNIAIEPMGEVEGIKDIHEYFNDELPKDIERRRAHQAHYKLPYVLFKQYVGKWIEHDAYPDVVATLYRNMSTTGCFEYLYSAINYKELNFEILKKLLNPHNYEEIVNRFDGELQEKIEEMVERGLKELVDYVKDMVAHEVEYYMGEDYENAGEPHIEYYREKGLIEEETTDEIIKGVIDSYPDIAFIEVYPVEHIVDELKANRIYLGDTLKAEADDFERFIHDVFDLPIRYRKYFNSLFVQLSFPF